MTCFRGVFASTNKTRARKRVPSYNTSDCSSASTVVEEKVPTTGPSFKCRLKQRFLNGKRDEETEYQQAHQVVMQWELQSSASQAERLRNELESSSLQLNLLREENYQLHEEKLQLREKTRRLEASALEHYLVHYDVEKYIKEYLHLPNPYETPEQQIADANATRLWRLQKKGRAGRAKRIQSELENGLTSTLEQLQIDVAPSKNPPSRNRRTRGYP
ncbi:hypothetical protein AJ78_04527 [Emergomyces pasteurianus Ep9510]|uniref:Uncharacterized protein n=1 Tax=Emergomyces pasteurianus Ep9510 TaxID=1447872 RepID=A0A1J9QGZ8_9EURO|nr:hypothetical protein AJ78_04527 [Emergomyces pasteurianus Ep9510]